MDSLDARTNAEEANKESPAPETSTGLLFNAGKRSVLIAFPLLSTPFNNNPSAPNLRSMNLASIFILNLSANTTKPFISSFNSDLASNSVGVTRSAPLNFSKLPI